MNTMSHTSQPPTTSPAPTSLPTPSGRTRRRWFWFTLLGLSAVAAVVWGYFVWLRATAPTPPDIELAHVDPLVADAIGQARDGVLAKPHNPAAWGELAIVLHAHDFYADAKQCYTQAERLDPTNPAWPYLLGDCYCYEGDPTREAIPHFRRALSIAGQNPTARTRLGELLTEAGEFDEAEALFREVLVDDPGEPRAHLGLARVALTRGNARAGLTHIHNCIARAGDIPRACTLLAEAYHVLGEHDLAADAHKRATKHTEPFFWPDPFLDLMFARRTGFSALSRKATALYKANRGSEALVVLEELARRYPDNPLARNGLGRMYVLINQPAVGEPHLREALRMDPDLVEARYNLASALMQLEQRGEAVVELRRVLEQQPHHAEAHLKLGQCLYLQNDKVGAAVALRDAIRYAPNNAKAQKNLGVVLFELRDYADAVIHLELATTLAPDDQQLASLLTRAKSLAAHKAK